MTNRLEFFRQQMASFEGTSDPQKAIEKGYYIEQPRNSLANTIAAKIALRPTSRHLLIGGIGSGKTTQLLMTCDRLNEIEDISAHYVDVSLYTDISEIKPGSLLAITGLVLSKLRDDWEEIGLKDDINYIDKYAYGSLESISLETINNTQKQMEKISDKFGLKNKHFLQTEGLLNLNKESKKKYKNIHQKIQLIKSNLSKHKFIVLLFDGLDRFNDNESMLKLIQADIELISQLNLGIILVSPISLNYDNYQEALKQEFNNNVHYQPYFDIENDENAHDFFDNILKLRSSENFIQKSARELLIAYSGGILRDLINLTQNSIEEAYFSDSDILEESHVNSAINSFSQTKIFGISNPELEILEKVARGETFLPRSDEHIHLLITQAILEYHYPKKRYAVHPALLPLIQKTLA
ncbi:hypothetical protein [Crocosphaera sp. XPORK-15E]|uniref:hypothetical protein n=1 Tax=Crocosphaera sp. XPORK-15E TaxID=3110247 RepID=UPI002B1F1574|nr:hypothetical protein [Crocosphaera sp. XPORK-15E]MEA5535260.1 hypothetical protein [Crocosphaera sp. XPORK-15E]